MSTLSNQQTEVHLQLGNGAPKFLPTAIGQHYIDIANRRVYQSVGINSVEDWALPLATLKDIQELDLVGDKAGVGLGNVEDYGVASQSEAELGQANDRYMTPLRVTQLLDALFMPVLDTFMARRDNPHQVTAEQVGALTSEATQLLLDEKLAEGDLAGLLQAFWAESDRLFYPVVHVDGSLAEDNYVMPTPADVWAQVKTNAVLEQVDTIYAVGVKRLLPGNLLALTSQEGMTLHDAVSQAQEGPGYVIMRAGIEDTEWTVITDPLLGCVARLSKHCVVVGDNTERFVPGQTLFYNGFEALSENVYYDWTLMADKEWEVTTFTGTDLVIDSARYHRSEIRIQSTGPVTVTFDVPTDLPYEMEVRFVNQTGVEVTFAGGNVVSVPRMQQYTLTKVNGVVRAVRYTNTSVALAGDLDEAFFVNPDYSEPQD